MTVFIGDAFEMIDIHQAHPIGIVFIGIRPPRGPRVGFLARFLPVLYDDLVDGIDKGFPVQQSGQPVPPAVFQKGEVVVVKAQNTHG